MTAQWQLQRHDNQAKLMLHAQFYWSNEHDWTAIAQTEPVYTLSGAIDIQQGKKQAGRVISLSGEHARINRQDLDTLKTWLNVAELDMTLTHPDGREFKVIFSRPALSDIVEIKPYRPVDQSPQDLFRLNLHFIEI
ncbi:hypothetical protein [Acinetobacter sp. c3-l95]|uniref:hypothetical protein n=1 Tax=Acinetobacter sp. c3-l95 TaxID=3342804 RepID=UPI0035BB10C6